ncbi:MAG: transcription antitermination factor NusB [Desulfococcaceae bacterium]|jgi:N utilization substance protein B|nr:transcription antitermination factor NusB [Desulfococcaceae bacterium]
MKNRRTSREKALEALFYMDIRQDISREALELYCLCFPLTEKTSDFFQTVTRGVMRNRSHIDTVLARFSDNWKISRMSCVDRNIMRIAVYEMFYCADIPYKVSINEAIDIGKKYGTDESGSFINGILDRIHIALEEKELFPASESEDSIPAQSFSPLPRKTKEDNPERIAFSRVRGQSGVVKRRTLSSSASDALEK